MKEQLVSKAYAKAITKLGEENNVDVSAELTKFTEVVNSSNDLENLFFLDVFTIDEKLLVFAEITKKVGLSPLVENFIKFLFSEKRISLFPLIHKDVVVQDDHKKGFLRGTIEGAGEEVSAEFNAEILKYLKEKLNKDIELTYVQSENVTAGYKVTVEDLQLDASLDNQLKKFKESVLNA